MKFLDERIEFDFSNVGNTYNDSTYRYDVLIDGELVFVGNVFIESTSTGPIIDVTDIVRNYFEVLKPSFPSTPTKTGIIKEVTVTLYNKTQTDEENLSENVYFIYRQQNYNSEITTPIIDTTQSQIGSMPMLQGWNYSNNKGLFIPTYPVNPSEKLTFDFISAYQNVPFVNDYFVNYSDGSIDNPTRLPINGNGIYQYSLPLNTLIRGVYEDINMSPTKVSDYLALKVSQGTSIDDSGTLQIQSSSDIPISEAVIFTITNNGYSTIDPMTNNSTVSGIFSSTLTLTFEPDLIPETIRIQLANGSILVNTTTLTPQNLPDNLNSIDITFGVSYNSLQKRILVTVKPIINYTKISTICEAESINILSFSPVNSGQRYEQTVAYLDNKSRYFLKWRDRYGMPQIQPFKGTYNYKENISRSTVTNYKNTKKLTDATIQGSWILNTDYIPEKLYPFYESIFVSPYLQLYDAKEDRLYDVILVNTEYNEKTFNNQSRNLFNLQLEVELDTTQNIIY